jgi:hypothetical protein
MATLSFGLFAQTELEGQHRLFDMQESRKAQLPINQLCQIVPSAR